MLKLNDIFIPSFVKVNKVEFSILPTITNNTLSVRGRKGVYLFGQEMNERKIVADVTIKADKLGGVMSKTRELAKWLYHPEPVKLEIPSDEPDLYYMVVPDGETNISEILKIGQGTITFLCTDAVAFGLERVVQFTAQENAFYNMNVGGTAETFPEVELIVREKIQSISVVADNGQVTIGEPAGVDKTPTNPYPVRFRDHMENITGWTEGVNVDGGTVTGTFESTNGYGVQQAGKNYGTGTGWHGAAKIASVPTPLQDFEVKAWVNCTATAVKQVGRVEVYLRDINGHHMGKIAIVDNKSNAEIPRLEARAGDLNASDGHYFVVKEDAAFKDFYGTVQISRRKTKWTAIFTKIVSGRPVKIFKKEWYDTNNQFLNKLGSVQIHVGAYGTHTPVNTLMISRVDVIEYVELTATQAPIIADTGDVLTVDCANAVVYKNGEIFYEGIDPSSSFFSLQAGVNGLYVTAPATTVTVRYRERWL
ncbi:phage tail family protein [Cytobacillus firmus]|nr:phage tail family protein [Cytobacillus firmus]